MNSISVRVAGLRQQARTGITRPSSDGMTPQQQVDRHRSGEAGALMAEQQRIWSAIRKEMKKGGPGGLAVQDDLSDADKAMGCGRASLERVFPVLTPLAIEPVAPVPVPAQPGFCRWLRAAVRRWRAEAALCAGCSIPSSSLVCSIGAADARAQAQARSSRSRTSSHCSLDTLFPDCVFEGALHAAPRCATAISRSRKRAEDLIREFEILLKQRRRGRIVRMEIELEAPEDLKASFVEEIGAEPDRLVESRRASGYGQLRPADHRQTVRTSLFKPYRAALPGAGPRAQRRHLRGDAGEGHSGPPSL